MTALVSRAGTSDGPTSMGRCRSEEQLISCSAVSEFCAVSLIDGQDKELEDDDEKSLHSKH